MNPECLKHKIAYLQRKRQKLNSFLSDYGFKVFTGEITNSSPSSGNGKKLELGRKDNIRNIWCDQLDRFGCPFEYYSYLNAAVRYPDEFRKLVAYNKLLKKLRKEQRTLDEQHTHTRI